MNYCHCATSVSVAIARISAYFTRVLLQFFNKIIAYNRLLRASWPNNHEVRSLNALKLS